MGDRAGMQRNYNRFRLPGRCAGLMANRTISFMVCNNTLSHGSPHLALGITGLTGSAPTVKFMTQPTTGT
jgi:hypothetical protein